MKSQWLGWIQELQAIAQNGPAYSKGPYSLRRFEELRELLVNILDSISREQLNKVLDLFEQELGAAIPKIDVRGVILRDGKMLLVREKGIDI